MRVTFDSNVWEKVVAPDAYRLDPKFEALCAINKAISAGTLKGYISETFATLEAIRKGDRAGFLEKRAEDLVKVTWHRSERIGHIRGTVEIGGASSVHPGLSEPLASKLRQARELGFLLIPSSRIGSARPAIIDDEQFRIPLTAEQSADIWAFLDERAAISAAIEARGVGFAKIEQLARSIQQRLGLGEIPWYEGLNRPADATESKKIDKAFAEWADGDTVAGHIACKLDILCTEDQGKGAGQSIFNLSNRQWLSERYGVVFMDINELARVAAASL